MRGHRMEEISKVQTYDELRDYILKYSNMVAKDRALPDIRDGFKPVQRRIITSMLVNKNTSSNKPVKVAKRVGDVMGIYHPHGDSSIYDALVRMNAWWKNQVTTVKIKGNEGSIFGDNAAAMRYIEVNLTPIGDAYGYKLSPEIVPFVKNYDETTDEPTILPAQLPFLLINGASGVASGIAVSIPTHNPIEVINAFIAYTKNNKISLDELMEIMPGPDFPTGAEIINKSQVRSLYETGVGKLRLRARIEYDEQAHQLHIIEVPFTSSGTIDALTESIVSASMPTEKVNRRTGKVEKLKPKLPFITKVFNYSGRDGLDIQINLAKDVDPDQAVQELYAKTPLEATMPYQFISLNDKKPAIYSLKQYFREYLSFQHFITKNEFISERKKLEKRFEIVKGLLIMKVVIDEVIASAKASTSKEELQEVLETGKILDGVPKKFHKTIKTFQFTPLQAEHISKLPIYRINKMDTQELIKEGKRLESDIAYVTGIIESDTRRKNLIIKRHEQELTKLDPEVYQRKTVLVDDSFSVSRTLEVPTQPRYVSIDKYQYVRIEDTEFSNAIKLTNKERIGFFDETGCLWNIHLEKESLTTGRGTLVNNLLGNSTNIIGMTTNVTNDKGHLGLFIFNNGNVRVTDLNHFMTKSKATKVNGGKDLSLQYYTDIPDGVKSVTINDKTYMIENLCHQTKFGSGRKTIEPCETITVSFSNEGIESTSITEPTNPKVTFTKDGLALFSWNGEVHDGLFTIDYDKLLNSTLLFVHTDGTAKKVSGEQFKVSTKRKQIQADKKGYESLFIGEVPDTLIGTYTDGYVKKIETANISQQGKVGGGVRVLYTQKHQLEKVEDGANYEIEISSYQMQPKLLSE